MKHNFTLTIAFVCSLGIAHAQVVTTLADSPFDYPYGVATDANGFVYVADQDNNAIEKVLIATGEVTVLAGDGTAGSVDGIGSAAKFKRPTGVVTDGKGNLYVADRWNHNIRKIEISTGVVTTIAGMSKDGSADGTGIAASFSYPSGLTIAGDNMYVADAGNNMIRKIVLSTAVVTTIAGATTAGSTDGTGTAARFFDPRGIVWDGNGNLFVADQLNYKIRKIVVSTGVVSTIAGSGFLGSANGTGTAASFNDPSGVAYDAKGYLYVADASNNQIRKIVLSTAAVSTLAGSLTAGYLDATGTAARFTYPTGLALDAKGNLFVADQENSKIRKIVLTPVGIDAYEENASSFAVSPNPFNERATLTFNKEQKNSTIKVMDTLGKEVKSASFSGTQFSLEKESLHRGIYFIHVLSGNKNLAVQKIVIQ